MSSSNSIAKQKSGVSKITKPNGEQGNKAITKPASSNWVATQTLQHKSKIVEELMSPVSKSKLSKTHKNLIDRSRGLGTGLPGAAFEFGLKGSVRRMQG